MVVLSLQNIVGWHPDEEDSDTFQRLILLSFAALILEVPQTLLGIFGYGYIYVIALETILVVAGFLVTVHAIVSRKMIKGLSPTLMILVFVILVTVPEAIEFTIVQHFSYTSAALELASAIFLIIVALTWLRRRNRSRNDFYVLAGIAVLITALLGTAAWIGSARYPTDELLINLFSAHLFLLGKNPYLPANTANAFSYYGFGTTFTLSFATPKLTGGLVTDLSYPALSFLYFIPANLFHLNAPASTIPIYVIPAFILGLAYRLRSKELGFAAVVLVMLNPQYFFQISMGYLDVLWVSFVMLSIFVYDRPWISGIFFGLALSVKQDPVFLAPFIIILIWKELGGSRAVKWILSAVLAFLVVNSYLIYMSPTTFFSAMLRPETSGLIGIGFGPSQISFLGYVPLTPHFFTVATVSTFLLLLAAYATFFDRLKYSFVSFPILIYLFNYRLLLEYIMFWPVIAMVIPSILLSRSTSKYDHKGTRKSLHLKGRTKIVGFTLVAIILVASTAGYALYNEARTPVFKMTDISYTVSKTGYVTEISLEIRVGSDFNYSTPVLFRIMHEGALNDSNGLLWVPQGRPFINSSYQSIDIFPLQPSQQFNMTGTYLIVAYYGDTVGRAELFLK